MVSTVGEYLLEKATNMQCWLHNELHDDKERTRLTEMSVTVMASRLHMNAQAVRDRDWDTLLRVASSAGLTDLTDMIEAVRSRGDLHDKFWRYLDLFVELMSSN